MSLKEHLKRVPGLAATVRWLGLRAPSDWLYQRSVLEGICSSDLQDQLPRLYRLFVRYCRLYLAVTPLDRVYGAKFVFNIVSNLQRLFADRRSARLTVGDSTVFFDLHDPRFLEVFNEVTLAEHTDTRVLPSLLTAGDTFVDIGANQGSFSLVAARLIGDSGRLVAVEPQPHLAKNLEKSLQVAGRTPFEVHQTAVGDRNGTVELLVPRNYSGTAGVYSDHSGLHRHRTLQVPLRRFDDLVDWESFTGSVLVKLDIEGSEFAFLQGAREMLGALHPALLLEVNPNPLQAARTDVSDLVGFLRRLGYSRYRRTPDLTTFHPLDTLEVERHENIVVST